MLNFVLDSEIVCYDIRNPSEFVLSIEHFCQIPPQICTKMMDLQEYKLDRGINQNTSLPQFETLFQNFINNTNNEFSLGASSSTGVGADLFKSSHLLYSPRHNGEALLLNNFQPLQKKIDIENGFNYEVIKEINNSLSRFSLYNGLTRFRRWPRKLYCSNFESEEARLRGGALFRNGQNMFGLTLDNMDCLCLQALDFVAVDPKKKGLGLSGQLSTGVLSPAAGGKPGGSYQLKQNVRHLPLDWDEEEEGVLKLNEINFLLKSAGPNLKGSDLFPDSRPQESPNKPSNTNFEKKDEIDFGNDNDNGGSHFEADGLDELELEDLKDDFEYKQFYDLRGLTEKMVKGKDLVQFGDPQQRDEMESLMKLASEDIERRISQNNHRGQNGETEFLDSLKDEIESESINKRKIQECKQLGNDKFYLTKGLMDFYESNWDLDEDEDQGFN